MPTNKNHRFFRCFSGKLKKFLLEKDIDYILRAKDYYTNNTFWLFERNTKLSKALDEWSNTNPLEG